MFDSGYGLLVTATDSTHNWVIALTLTSARYNTLQSDESRVKQHFSDAHQFILYSLFLGI